MTPTLAFALGFGGGVTIGILAFYYGARVWTTAAFKAGFDAGALEMARAVANGRARITRQLTEDKQPCSTTKH